MKLNLSKRALVSGIALLVAGGLLGGAAAYWFVQHKSAVIDAASAAAAQKTPSKSNAAMPGMDMSGGQGPGKASGSSQDMANMPGMDMSGESGSGQSSKATEGTPGGQMAGMQMPGGNMPAGTVMLDPATQQQINVTYTTVKRQHLVRTVQTVGLLQMDEEKIARVHVKVAGWIEKVFLNYAGQEIKKGQPLFTLYSPDLVST